MHDPLDPKRSGEEHSARAGKQARRDSSPNTGTTTNPKASDPLERTRPAAALDAGHAIARAAVDMASRLEADLVQRGAALLVIANAGGDQAAVVTAMAAFPAALAIVEARGWRIRVHDLDAPADVVAAWSFAAIDVPPGVNPATWVLDGADQ